MILFLAGQLCAEGDLAGLKASDFRKMLENNLDRTEKPGIECLSKVADEDYVLHDADIMTSFQNSETETK